MGNPVEGFNVGDLNTFMPVPPSGSVDLQHSTPPALLDTDLLMQGGMVGTLNMAELQEGVEDATSQNGVMPYGSDFPFSAEELVAFQRVASEFANSLADPATYFYDQANHAIAQYRNYTGPLQSSQSEVTEPGALVSDFSMLPHGSVSDGSAVRMGDLEYAGFDFSPLHPQVGLQADGSVPSLPPTPATSVEPALPPMDAPPPDHAAVPQYTSDQPRYVPPAGAGFMSRRRVGGHYGHPPAAFDSAESGSGMA
ncbi:hypothetical protein BD413DRAFT_92453 [Trametes elegans]|nr:hypothetical protein BD413DRAFT_92453 [Trametes elegans]